MKRVCRLMFVGMVLLVLTAEARQPEQMPLPAAHQNARLILKDGSYQLVREYHIEGDRVIYISVERGVREELPRDLVDWPATARWAEDHGADSRAVSPGMKAAAELDRQQQAEREDEAARRPLIAPGLRLPDSDAMFVVDSIHGKVEAVEMAQTAGAGSFSGRTVLRAEIASLVAKHRPISLAGGEARLRIHSAEPVFYLGLPESDEAEAPEGALTVDTHGASSALPNPPSPLESRFVLVKVEERIGERRISAAMLSEAVANADGHVWPLVVTPLAGRHWIRLQCSNILAPGEYVVAELLKAGVVNLAVWDFALDPGAPENPRAIEAITP